MPLTAARQRAAAVNGGWDHRVMEEEHEEFRNDMTNFSRRHHKSSKKKRPSWLIAVRFAKNILPILIAMGFVHLALSEIRTQLHLMGNKIENIENDTKLVDMDSKIDSRDLVFADLQNQLNKLVEVEHFLQNELDFVKKKVETTEKNVRELVASKLEIQSELNFVKKKVETSEINISGLVARKLEMQSELNFVKKKVETIEKDAKELVAGQLEMQGELDFAKKKFDTIKEDAGKLVADELEKHAADGIGRPDYALYSQISLHSDSDNEGQAYFMVSPSLGEPYQCFPLNGNSGFVVIPLRWTIAFDAVTLEHVSERVSYYDDIARSSAPKDCRIYGWLEDPDSNSTIATSDDMTLLTKFTYDLESKNNVQTFNASVASRIINTIRFDIDSNHGADYTCIYRLRVHGHKP